MRMWIRAAIVCCLCSVAATASAQNWLLTIRDTNQGTSIYQVNGTSGGIATLYGSIDNLTGTSGSDDGSGNAAPSTILDFAGFGFIQYPGQIDLGNLYVPPSLALGYPKVSGSLDGINPGSSPFVSLGTFDLSNLGPGIYYEDFIASAYPDDPTSTVVFGDITGTLTLSVAPASTVPEASTLVILSTGVVVLLTCCLLGRQRKNNLLHL